MAGLCPTTHLNFYRSINQQRNVAAAKPTGRGFSAAKVEKHNPPPKEEDGTKVAAVEALSRDDRKRGGYQFAKTLGCERSHLPQKCEMFQGLKPVDRERIIQECNMCPFCMRQEAGQEC
jgi:hypothetical protein